MLLGQPGPALDAADELIENLPGTILRPMANWLEAFIAMKQHVLVRFGRWRDILGQSLPEDDELYCVTTALMRYARTVALANTGELAEADAERERFLAARDRVPDRRMLFNNTCHDILNIAEQMLTGEVEYHKGDHEAAFEHLRRAVELDDNLPYDEPWGWMPADPPRPRRALAGARSVRRGGGGLPGRSRFGWHAEPSLSASGERLESTRPTRVPDPPKRDGRGWPDQAPARQSRGARGGADQGFLLLPTSSRGVS